MTFVVVLVKTTGNTIAMDAFSAERATVENAFI